MHRRKSDLFSMLVVDLDFFKAINDQYGHDVGDEVLRQVAKLVKDSVRRSDTVYRVGGRVLRSLTLHRKESGLCRSGTYTQGTLPQYIPC